MGIDGLLNLLRPVTQKQHISTFKNQRIAIDAMPWIYKGCYSCAMELNQNIESIDFLYYILEMLDMLSYYNIKPIFVFDGRAVHAKSETLEKRKKSKQQNKAKGLQFLKNNQMQQARKYLSRCIIIDQRIIAMTINCLITKNIEFIVAPYEADCQIAKLRNLGLVDTVISEDSDLIAFGVNVILKLNQNGECDYVDLKKWRPRDVNDVFLKYFLAFDSMNRVDAAILAGSDYNASVKGIGIKRAIKLLTTQATMKNVINKLKFKKTYMQRIPQDYQQIVQRSKLIFMLSTVYNPLTNKLQYLNPQLLDQLKPQLMTEQQLRQIVGRHYQYDQQVANGKVASKTLQKREIKLLNFPQMFRVNKENMMAHQAVIKKRKLDQQQQKRKQLSQIQQLNINNSQQQFMHSTSLANHDDAIYTQLHEFKRRAGQQQTRQQIQKRKQQRKNRINKLHELMSTVVDVFGEGSEEEEEKKLFGDSDQEDRGDCQVFQEEDQLKRTAETIQVPESIIKNDNNLIAISSSTHNNNKDNNFSVINNNNKSYKKAPIQHKANNPNNTTKQQKYIQEKDNTSQQQSVEDDLGFLNPFIKKDVNNKK